MVSEWDVPVNTTENADEFETGPSRSRSRRHALVIALVVILALEAVVLAAATIYFVIELLTTKPASVASALTITAIIALATIWVGFIVAGVLRGQAWTRAAVVVVQVLFAAVAIGSFQGPDPQIALGVALLIPALVVLVLLFSKPVLAATAGRSDQNRML